MSREIKFRAWDILSKRMMEDIELWLIPYGVLFPHTPDQRCLELMQFTGLLDKNGKEIYEGDVLRWWWSSNKFNDKEPLLIKWGTVGWILKSKLFKLGECVEFNTEGYIENSEVIGNIYENPELLEALG